MTTRASFISSSDLDAARLEVLRHRILVLMVVIGAMLIGLTTVAQLVLRGHVTRPQRLFAAAPAFAGTAMIVFGFAKLRRRRSQMNLQQMVGRSVWLVVVAILTLMPTSELLARAIEQILIAGGRREPHVGVLIPLDFGVLFLHLAASIVVPWTLREAAIPTAIVAVVMLAMGPFSPDPWIVVCGDTLMLIVVSLPGMLICALRTFRFREVVERRFLIGRYSEVQRELEYARRIHEQLFPQPITTGPLRFTYRYEPMQQIGGDFVDVIRRRDGRELIVVLVDVTGHGIAAALAVNRLQGEAKRVLGRGENVSPGDVIRALNEYIHLTLADENVYATAMVIRISTETRTLAWASAGHPPAFVVRANSGAIERLNSTTMLLGPLGDADYENQDSSTTFEPGDVLIAYTDGAIECKDASGALLGIDGLERTVQAARHKDLDGTLDHVADRIARYRHGATEDDTVLLAVRATEENT